MLVFPMILAAIEIGEKLPPLKGEFLNGRDAQLPEVAAGKVAFVAMGFTYKSRFAVEDFAKRFRADFGKERRATFFEVPVIGGMAVMGKWFIDSGMRRGTPKEDHEHVITVYGGAGEWKRRMGYQAEAAAYLFVLDPHGKVAWKYTGPFTEGAYRDLAAQMKKLLL
ncbi:MAG: hypothetical protein INH43_06880 [Acidobacteriaceae bacterium]|nr:hypothetical protein [Acidobacteriaceae bacterium]